MIFIILDAKLLNSILYVNGKQLNRPVLYRDTQETGPRPWKGDFQAKLGKVKVCAAKALKPYLNSTWKKN